jgi:molecular chaperone GrpE (heat shock protein)
MSDEDGAALDRVLAGLDFSRAAAAAQESHRHEMETVLNGLIEVVDAIDGIERVVAHEAASGPLPRTIERVRRKAAGVLAEAGVERIPCTGLPVDVRTTEVVGVRARSGHADDVVLEEIVAGYTWRGRTLRRPKVVVAGNQPGPSTGTSGGSDARERP